MTPHLVRHLDILTGRRVFDACLCTYQEIRTRIHSHHLAYSTTSSSSSEISALPCPNDFLSHRGFRSGRSSGSRTGYAYYSHYQNGTHTPSPQLDCRRHTGLGPPPPTTTHHITTQSRGAAMRSASTGGIGGKLIFCVRLVGGLGCVVGGGGGVCDGVWVVGATSED